jgi:hypothetical protein
VGPLVVQGSHKPAFGATPHVSTGPTGPRKRSLMAWSGRIPLPPQARQGGGHFLATPRVFLALEGEGGRASRSFFDPLHTQQRRWEALEVPDRLPKSGRRFAVSPGGRLPWRVSCSHTHKGANSGLRSLEEVGSPGRLLCLAVIPEQ